MSNPIDITMILVSFVSFGFCQKRFFIPIHCIQIYKLASENVYLITSTLQLSLLLECLFQPQSFLN
jgi:hypothetical protein